MGKIQVYNKKFQNSKLSKIRFWLKQVFIEKKQMVPFEGELHSVTLFVYAIPRACIWFNCSKKHNNALNVHKIKKIPGYPHIAHTIDVCDNDYMIN